MNEPWWIDFIKAFVIINLLLGMFAYMTWVERKVLGRMQLRYGPNRAGWFGLLQPIADLVKLIRKESFYPLTRSRVPLHQRAADLGRGGARRLLCDPVGRGLAHRGLRHLGRDPRRAHLADPDLRARRARGLRVHHRRLGVRLEVRAARLDADLRAARLVRGRARPVGARRRAHGRLALADGDRRPAAGHGLVRGAPAHRPARLLRGGHG